MVPVVRAQHGRVTEIMLDNCVATPSTAHTHTLSVVCTTMASKPSLAGSVNHRNHGVMMDAPYTQLLRSTDDYAYNTQPERIDLTRSLPNVVQASSTHLGRVSTMPAQRTAGASNNGEHADHGRRTNGIGWLGKPQKKDRAQTTHEQHISSQHSILSADRIEWRRLCVAHAHTHLHACTCTPTNAHAHTHTTNTYGSHTQFYLTG